MIDHSESRLDVNDRKPSPYWPSALPLSWREVAGVLVQPRVRMSGASGGIGRAAAVGVVGERRAGGNDVVQRALGIANGRLRSQLWFAAQRTLRSLPRIVDMFERPRQWLPARSSAPPPPKSAVIPNTNPEKTLDGFLRRDQRASHLFTTYSWETTTIACASTSA